jgi:carbamoyltransferase
MKILAFNIAHDSSVSYFEDGELKFFCKEERLSRNKRDGHPFKALELFRSKFNVQLDECLYLTPSNFQPEIEATYSAYVKKHFNIEMINYSGLLHHLCHASLAFYNSGFDEALVFVVDRNGSMYFMDSQLVARESESIYVASTNNGIEPVYKNFFLSDSVYDKLSVENTIKLSYPPECEVKARSSFGLVTMYEAATTLIGQNQLENGKTMGLSSYSSKEDFPSLVLDGIVDERGLFYNNSASCFIGDEDKITSNITKENYKFYAEKAKHVQIESQRSIIELINKYTTKTKIKKVCIVGGYGLNVVANGKYLETFPDIEFYFEPSADDTGITLGAAMQREFEVTGTLPKKLTDNFYHYYEDSEEVSIGVPASIEEVCDLLISQKTVAIFEGSPEAGPRALGHRSILFDPRNIDTKEIVNKVKKREWYRPFAGAVLVKEFSTYFETLGLKESPYMMINFKAKDTAIDLVPGIIHVDGTSRAQTVSSGFFGNLLELFYEKTGCPILLNTSFNLAGEPLVQTKEEAIDVLKRSKLDAVYFVEDGRLVTRDHI